MDRAGNNGVSIKQLQAKRISEPTHGACHSNNVNFPGKDFSD